MKIRKLLMVLAISTLAITGLVACGSEEAEDVVVEETADAEEEVVEEEVVEEEAVEEEAVEEESAEEEVVEETADIANISDALAGTIWIDNSMTTFGFETDGVTLYLYGADGSEYVGEYALVADESGTVVLGLAIPDVEVEAFYAITEIGEDYLLLVDTETGEEVAMAPVDAVE